MEYSFSYTGCFVNREELAQAVAGIRREPLDNDIRCPHVTFSYMPEEVDRTLFGKQVKITALGYGNDGSNEGLLVRLESGDPELQAMIGQIAVPHITLALSDGSEARKSKYLHFERVAPFELIGTFGGFDKSGKVVVSSEEV